MASKISPINAVLALYANDLKAYVQRAFLELRDGSEFRDNLHIQAICHQLERVERGDVKRRLVLMPPRSLKSHCVSVAFTAWLLGRNPTLRLICASYGADLAEGFSRDVGRLIEAPWHRAAFPGLQLDPRKASAEELRTTRNGVRYATPVGGSLTGKGGDILIIDDPIKAEDAGSQTKRQATWEWFTTTAISRLDNPKTGAIVVVAQRLHEDDLPGRLIQSDGWEVLELPAIETRHREIALNDTMVLPRAPGDLLHENHIGQFELDRLRRELGCAAFNAQYQQAPTPVGGNIIRPKWFGTYTENPIRSKYEAV